MIMDVLHHPFLTKVVSLMLLPKTPEQMVHSYLFWLAFFFIINLLWDILTPLTPPFHLHRLKEKPTLLMEATSFCSSALLLGSVLDKQTALVVGSTPVPALIAAAVGLLLSISALCPYSKDEGQSGARLGNNRTPSN